MSKKNKEFKNRIAEVRKARGLSQMALGEMIDSSGDMIGRYERGIIFPSIDVIISISDVLDVSIDYLVCKMSVHIDNETSKRLEKIDDMPKEEKDIVCRVVDSLLREYNTRKSYE
jgi:transcriptional regulator with XRE-family HTH domain